MAVALAYLTLTVAALHSRTLFYDARISAETERAALVYIFRLTWHKIYYFVFALLVKFAGVGVLNTRDVARIFNNDYRQILQENGLALSGMSPDGLLVETSELTDRPFYVGVQYHPEFKSRPNKPHPLFKGFIGAAFDRIKKDL